MARNEHCRGARGGAGGCLRLLLQSTDAVAEVIHKSAKFNVAGRIETVPISMVHMRLSYLLQSPLDVGKNVIESFCSKGGQAAVLHGGHGTQGMGLGAFRWLMSALRWRLDRRCSLRELGAVALYVLFKIQHLVSFMSPRCDKLVLHLPLFPAQNEERQERAFYGVLIAQIQDILLHCTVLIDKKQRDPLWLTMEILPAQQNTRRRMQDLPLHQHLPRSTSAAVHGRRMHSSPNTLLQPTAAVNSTVPDAVYTSPPTPGAAPSAATDSTYTRLHIAPLDPNLLKTIVPSAVLPSIRGLSYHTIQTFPDKPYGFVELPSADALKIKNKLNGAVLKGAKIRIEPARPTKMPTPSEDAVRPDVDAASEAREKSKKTKKDKKRKRDALELVGVELEEGRKVRRGWTVTSEETISKKKKEKEKSKGKDRDKDRDKDKQDSRKSSKKERRKKEPESLYTNNAECLVKTLLPPNKRDLTNNDSGKANKRVRKGQQQAVLVHEFERNTKFATFLKNTQDLAPEQAATSFVEGQGWVGEDGTVVENVKITRPTAFPKMQVARPDHSAKSISWEGTSSRNVDTSSEDESETELDVLSMKRAEPALRHISPGKEKRVVSDVARPKSSSSARSLTINIPPATPASGVIHPLEALYKRHKHDETGADQTAKTSEPFIFGGLGDDLGNDDTPGPGETDRDKAGDSKSPYGKQSIQPPMTPFTEQDLEWRNVRSAAPTPDTAHPSRISRLWFPGQGDEALGALEEGNEKDGSDSDEAPSGQKSDDDQGYEDPANNSPANFQQLFWERRAELNRSWKKRRRISAKEKRYRENKAVANRAI